MDVDTLRILMIRDDVIVVRKFFVADCANAALLPDFAVEELPHLPRRSHLSISTRMMRILNLLDSPSDQLWFGEKLPAAAGERSMDRAQLIATKPHDIPLERRK